MDNRGVRDVRFARMREHYDMGGKLPDRTTLMGQWLKRYCSPSHHMYDAEIHAWARSTGNQINKRRRSILCVENGVIYPSLTRAGEELQLAASGISAAARGRIKHAGGYTFKYCGEAAE